MNKTQLLFLVILIEGYVVLATELLAIRSLIPFVGSGTETISIIISAVLLPLAAGYHFGGNAFKTAFAKAKIKDRAKLSIRKILLRNITSSLIVLTLGLSYVFQEIFFGVLHLVKIDNKLMQTALFSALFLSFPVFMLGQTVPLISNYFSKKKLSEITGKMLFFSTAGSFLGSVFSTIILMSYAGVHYTVIITMSLLCFLILLLIRRIACFETILCLMVLGVVILLNNNGTMQTFKVVSNNAYNLIQIIDIPKTESKILSVNRAGSSMVSKDRKNRLLYAAYIEDNLITPIAKNTGKPLNILIIGGGGFTIGMDDKTNNYTFIDIDPDLKEVAEKYFLPEKLSPNRQFVASSARAYVHDNKNKYDIIIIDVFTNRISIPMECTTREFLLDVKALLKDKSIVLANVISSPTFNDKFTVRYHNTFASVFPVFSRQIITDVNLWNKEETPKNILYMYFKNEYTNDNSLYTDDKNTYSIDRKDLP